MDKFRLCSKVEGKLPQAHCKLNRSREMLSFANQSLSKCNSMPDKQKVSCQQKYNAEMYKWKGEVEKYTDILKTGQ
jgi:hypothetical protein